MALVTYDRTSVIQGSLDRVLTNNGYVSITDAPFLGEIVGAINSALTGRFSELYSIADNVDIGRATGEYLDRWGRFLKEPRSIPTYAFDMSLSNVSIYIDPGVEVGTITTDGMGITIPAGTQILDGNNTALVKTIDDIYIRANRSRAYCRVASVNTGVTYIGAGTLTEPDFSLSSAINVMPSALANYTLKGINDKEISGGASYADDQTYQYILEQKAASIGLFNSNKVNSLLDLNEIVSIYVHEYTGGAIVYLDTTDEVLTERAVQNARIVLEEYRSLGQSIQVYTPLTKRLKLRIQMQVKKPEYLSTTSATVKTYIANMINSASMGEVVNHLEAVTTSKMINDNIVGIRMKEATLDGREVTASYIPLHYNERVIISEGDITII